MARRQSDSQAKAEAAKKAAEIPDELEAQDGVEETLAEGAAAEAPAADELEDFDPAPAGADADLQAASSGAAPRGMFDPSRRESKPGIQTPNKPSFDWTRAEGGALEPRLMKGEEITDDRERHGVRVVRTNRGRFIYLCSIRDYQKAFGPLASLDLYRQAFPQAFA